MASLENAMHFVGADLCSANRAPLFLDMQIVAISVLAFAEASVFFVHNVWVPLFVLIPQAAVKLKNTNGQWIYLLFFRLDDVFAYIYTHNN